MRDIGRIDIIQDLLIKVISYNNDGDKQMSIASLLYNLNVFYYTEDDIIETKLNQYLKQQNIVRSFDSAIAAIIYQICNIWRKVPDLRLAQFIGNLVSENNWESLSDKTLLQLAEAAYNNAEDAQKQAKNNNGGLTQEELRDIFLENFTVG